MAVIESERIDAQRVRMMAKRLNELVAKVGEFADEMEREKIDTITAKNFASFDRALRELGRTITGLFSGYQQALNDRVTTVPMEEPRKRVKSSTGAVDTTGRIALPRMAS